MYSPFIQIIPIAAFTLWLAVVIYMLVMITRLVKGVERIADSVERGSQ